MVGSYIFITKSCYITYSAPELYEVQTKETNLSWYDSEDSDAETHARQNGSREKNKIAMTKLNTRPHGHPVIIDIDKEASHIGTGDKGTWIPHV